jgi:hypothetical protein
MKRRPRCFFAGKFKEKQNTIMGINPRNISTVCKGLSKHAGGYGWEYDSKEE